jgi:hypothetical protein
MRWRSVAEELPEKDGYYAVYYPGIDEPVQPRYYWTQEQQFEGLCDYLPTHWQPLPEPPKEEE